MNQSNLGLKFHFPFQPYSIQEKFMKELYFTIENNKSGIFESPTGTGKSLSICCSALQWLHDHNRAIKDELQTDIAKLKLEVSSNNGSIDWLQEEYEKIQKNQTLCTFQNKWSEIKKRNEKFLEMKKRVAKQKLNKGSKPTEVYFNNLEKHKKEKQLDNDDQIKKENIQTESSEDNDLILEECTIEEDEQSENEELSDEVESNTKIYISSRTHSQLSQFIGEIKQTVFNEDTRVVTLASRQHYCINPDVVKLKNVNLINERCLDLQKSKTKSTSVAEEGKVLKKTRTRSCSSCPYYNQTNINQLKERILTDIMDMEDLVKCAKELKGCPYYASRAALDDAEVALVSHAGIVSSGARSGMSLKLKDNVLIMDEAHGLTAALENAHSAPVSMKHLSSVKTFLQLYINKYRARLSSQNLLWLNQMQYVVGRLLGMVKSGDKNQESPAIFTLEDFVIEADIDHMKLTPLIEMCRKSKLAPKLHGFSMRYTPKMLEEEMKKSVPTKKNSLEKFLKNISKKKDNNENATQNIDEESKITQNIQVPAETSPGTGLYAVLDFLQMLCDRSENGRILVKKGDESSGQLKYLLLNPAEHFVEVVKQCRSVIVAGGTMEPIGEFVRLLTGTSESDDVTVVKCDHVVSPENVLAVCMIKGPSNVSLNFSYEQRGNSALLTEIGRILRNVCNVVPGGVVCFLPSYAYEQIVYEHLKQAGIIEAVNEKKTVFREPKSAADVEQVLSKYAAAVRNKSGDQNGALLLSVVGGKLSEGLNFSDDLGRCVMVVGMPYPNKNSPELKEKMSYLNRTVGAGAGSAHYESLCMKAVNQCIGRAVRHANDYACVLLLDERYSRPHLRNALPSFVQKSLLDNCPFGKAFGNIGKFFTKHKEK